MKYTDEQFLKSYLSDATFMDECLECKELLNKYEEFKNDKASINDLKRFLTSFHDTHEEDYFDGMSMAGES